MNSLTAIGAGGFPLRSMRSTRAFAAGMRRRSVVGLYEEDGQVFAVRLSRSVLGRQQITSRTILLPGGCAERRDGAWCEPWREPIAAAAVRGMTLAIRAEAVALACRPVEEQPDEAAPAPGLLSDQLAVSVGGRKLLLQATARREEVEPFAPILAMKLPSPASCEPAPWSAWRASLYHAPARPRRGIHVRFILGSGRGLAVLSHGGVLLTWQVMTWSGELRVQALVQAFRLLSIFAERRLGLGSVQHVSVQGPEEPAEGWHALEQALDLPADRLSGPAYDGWLIALGAALATGDPHAGLNLARPLQSPPSALASVPLGEAAFLFGLAVSLFLSLYARAARLETQLHAMRSRAARVEWARGRTLPDLRKERDELRSRVPALREYLEPAMRMAPFLAELPSLLPGHSKAVAAEIADDAWAENVDKKRGRRYVALSVSAPFAESGAMNQTLEAVAGSRLFQPVLSRSAVDTVDSQGQGDSGETVFTILCLPKGGPETATQPKAAQSREEGK